MAEARIKLIAEVQKYLADLKKADTGTKKFKRTLDKTTKSTKSATKATNQYAGALRAVKVGIAGLGLAFLARGFISNAVAFEKLRVKLLTFTGSAKEASRVWERLNKVAATTQVDVDKLINSYTQLRTVGIDPTNKEIQRLADLAAATGLEFEQLSNIIFRGTSSTELFYNAGITARVEGEKLNVTYQGVTQTIDRSSEAIKDYLVNLVEVNGYIGASERLAKGLGGAISNLSGNFKALVEQIGITTGFIQWLADNINAVANFFANFREEIVKTESVLEGFARATGLDDFVRKFELFEGGLRTGLARIEDYIATFFASVKDYLRLDFKVDFPNLASVSDTIATLTRDVAGIGTDIVFNVATKGSALVVTELTSIKDSILAFDYTKLDIPFTIPSAEDIEKDILELHKSITGKAVDIIFNIPTYEDIKTEFDLLLTVIKGKAVKISFDIPTYEDVKDRVTKVIDAIVAAAKVKIDFSFPSLPGIFTSNGSVDGPGTSTSDSVPALLSDGEFVVNADATEKNLDLLEAINDGIDVTLAWWQKIPGIQKLATGGLVGNANPQGTGSNLSANLVNSIQETNRIIAAIETQTTALQSSYTQAWGEGGIDGILAVATQADKDLAFSIDSVFALLKRLVGIEDDATDGAATTALGSETAGALFRGGKDLALGFVEELRSGGVLAWAEVITAVFALTRVRAAIAKAFFTGLESFGPVNEGFLTDDRLDGSKANRIRNRDNKFILIELEKQTLYLARIAVATGATGVTGVKGARLGKYAATAGAATVGATAAGAGAGGKLLSATALTGLLSRGAGLLRLVGKIAWPILAVDAIFEAFTAFNKDIAGVSNEDLSTLTKTGFAIASVVSRLTFGLVDFTGLIEDAVSDVEKNIVDITALGGARTKGNVNVDALNSSSSDGETEVKLNRFGKPFNTGGAVNGRGTGTSDSILARLSNGEYVINAKSANAIGLGNLDKLNRFASGGLVGYQTGGAIDPKSGSIGAFATSFLQDLAALAPEFQSYAKDLRDLREEINLAIVNGEVVDSRTRRYNELLKQNVGAITEMNEALAATEEGVEKAAQTFQEFYNSNLGEGAFADLRNSIQTNLANAFQTGDFKSAIKGIFRNLAAQFANQASKNFVDLLLGDKTGAGGLLTGLLGFNHGGVVPGTGSPLVDSVPALLAPGEVVTNPARGQGTMPAVYNNTININATDARSFKEQLAADPRFLANLVEQTNQSTQGIRR